MEDNKLCLEKQPLNQEMLDKIDAYWRAANYLSAGQLYLLDNPLLREPLTMDQIKKKIVGHWGTVPGQNFVYAHCNRVIKRYDLDMILLSGPGHGGNFMIANTYLEGSYSEVYPNISQDEEGMKKMFKQFSFPCGVPSHCAPETPGSINEGGELGYSIAHAFGAVFDNPDLIATTVVGDGEAETGPLATSWQSNKFLNPITDGAVLPILHLNGYKISNPTILARISREELEHFFDGCGWKPYFVEGDEPMFKALDLDMGDIHIIDHIVEQMEEELGTDREAALADMRYSYIEDLCAQCVVKHQETREQLRSEKIDQVLTSKYLCIPVFLLIMLVIFWLTFSVIGAPLQDLLGAWIDQFTAWLSATLTGMQVTPWLVSLIIDGVCAGVGSVLSFLPIIVLLFFFLSLLEDSGYITSYWGDEAVGARRKYYRITEKGREAYRQARAEWDASVRILNALLEGEA